METCKWCGRTLRPGQRTGAGQWYTVCSESCRTSLVDSIGVGKTPAFRTPTETGLGKLLKLGLVVLLLGFIGKSCGSEADSQSRVEPTTTESTIKAAQGEDALESAPPTARSAEDSPPTRANFGEPGQFDLKPVATPQPSESSGEGEIRTIPPPESSGTELVEQPASDSLRN